MVKSRALCGLIAACCVLVCAFTAQAEPPLPPKPDRYFNDYAKVVPADKAQAMNAKLEQFERDTTNQILVAVFPRLPEGTYLEDYCVTTAQAWGPGGKKRDNGLVLFAFISDRKVRMEVGYGLEGVVPDSIAASIIREQIAPQFKTGNYAAGLDQAIDALFQATRHEYHGTGQTLAETKASAPNGISTTTIVIVIVLLLAFLIWCHMGDSMIQQGGRFLFWNLLNVAFSGSGGSSGGGSSSSSGGFSSGGGSFGGGGASGDW